jgi:hypothetical protein
MVGNRQGDTQGPDAIELRSVTQDSPC